MLSPPFTLAPPNARRYAVAQRPRELAMPKKEERKERIDISAIGLEMCPSEMAASRRLVTAWSRRFKKGPDRRPRSARVPENRASAP